MNVDLNALPVYIKTEIRTYGGKVYTNVHARWWNRIGIFYSHFDWFVTCLQKQMLPAGIYRKFCLKNCRQANDKLSRWQSFWN